MGARCLPYYFPSVDKILFLLCLPFVFPSPSLCLTASSPPSSSNAPSRRLSPSRSMELFRKPLPVVVRSHQVLGIFTPAASLRLSSKPPFPPIPNHNIESRTISGESKE